MRAQDAILIVDDDKPFLDWCRDTLLREGYLVDTACDAESALDLLDQGRYAAVLIDQKLQGQSGPDSGLDLVSETGQRAPGAKPIIVTSYASAQAIDLAFAAGVYDYLEKNEFFETLLRHKLRNALEVSRESRLANMEHDEREDMLRRLWAETRRERDNNRKGKLLEDTARTLFSLVPGLVPSVKSRNNALEEIDIVIRNESPDPSWQKECLYWLVECKNWSKPVDVREVRTFLHKLHHRYGRSDLGFVIAISGITKPAGEELRHHAGTDTLVVPMDGDIFNTLIESSDRNGLLKSLHEDAMVSR